MAELLKEMRYELDQLLAEKIQDPKLDLVTYGKLIIDTIVHKQGEKKVKMQSMSLQIMVKLRVREM